MDDGSEEAGAGLGGGEGWGGAGRMKGGGGEGKRMIGKQLAFVAQSTLALYQSERKNETGRRPGFLAVGEASKAIF